MIDRRGERLDSATTTFTVFTATYNRAATLPRVFTSLTQQDFRDFEWLIVDDGSTDGTADLVRSWQRSAEFPIHYIYKPNGGKHTAWNVGLDNAKGRFFLSLDSDDACTPDALRVFIDSWESIEPDRRGEFTGVCALVKDANGTVIGDRFPSDVFDSDSSALRFQHHIAGEKWGFHRTDVVREFRFPEEEGVRYVPESVVWGRIAAKYQERFINRALRIYFYDADVRLSTPSWKDPRPFVLGTRAALNEQARRWFVHDPVFFCKAAANFARNSWLTGVGAVEQSRQLKGWSGRSLWAFMLPVGWLLYRSDARRRNRFQSETNEYSRSLPSHALGPSEP